VNSRNSKEITPASNGTLIPAPVSVPNFSSTKNKKEKKTQSAIGLPSNVTHVNRVVDSPNPFDNVKPLFSQLREKVPLKLTLFRND
jgi:hypothetical protein